MDLQEQSTRTAILNFLKINGSSEAKAMAEFCGLTTMAVRQHLLRLLADGLLQVRTERRPQGRPTHVYWLTELGDAQFPRDYAGLASDLLSTLAALDGKAKIKEVFRKRRSEMMTRYRARVKGKDLEERVCETVSILSECGYMAEAVPSGSREFLLTEHNCAIRDIAKCFHVPAHRDAGPHRGGRPRARHRHPRPHQRENREPLRRCRRPRHRRLRQRILPLHQRPGLQRHRHLAGAQARGAVRQSLLHADSPYLHSGLRRISEQAHPDERIAAQ